MNHLDSPISDYTLSKMVVPYLKDLKEKPSISLNYLITVSVPKMFLVGKTKMETLITK